MQKKRNTRNCRTKQKSSATKRYDRSYARSHDEHLPLPSFSPIGPATPPCRCIRLFSKRWSHVLPLGESAGGQQDGALGKSGGNHRTVLQSRDRIFGAGRSLWGARIAPQKQAIGDIGRDSAAAVWSVPCLSDHNSQIRIRRRCLFAREE